MTTIVANIDAIERVISSRRFERDPILTFFNTFRQWQLLHSDTASRMTTPGIALSSTLDFTHFILLLNRLAVGPRTVVLRLSDQ